MSNSLPVRGFVKMLVVAMTYLYTQKEAVLTGYLLLVISSMGVEASMKNSIQKVKFWKAKYNPFHKSLKYPPPTPPSHLPNVKSLEGKINMTYDLIQNMFTSFCICYTNHGFEC